MLKKNSPIRVLVVDDSALARELIREILSADQAIEVVGEAANGIEAISLVERLRPDIITMDIEMPVMGGMEAIERIIAGQPTPILAVTALTGVRTAFTAVSKGALDVIEKPDISLQSGQNLIRKIRLLSRVDVSAHLAALGKQGPPPTKLRPSQTNFASSDMVVAIAASTGGPQAIQKILSHLPATFGAPIVITQHIAEGFTQGMVDWLSGSTPLSVMVAASGATLAPGKVYINPAEYSMKISAAHSVTLSPREAKQIYNPSCNCMLSSIALRFGARTIGIILSGMGNDGVDGMQAIKTAGGMTIAQDEKSSVIYGMNRLAVERGAVSSVMSIEEIPAILTHLVKGR